jgi:hypothetical protein
MSLPQEAGRGKSQVELELDNLNRELDGLGGLIGDLENRLRPITLDPEPQNTAEVTAKDTLVEVAASIRSSRRTVQTYSAILDSLMSRVEV